VETARAEMDVNYFGLLRLAQDSARRCARAAPTAKASAVAWVNLLSIYAHANFPPHGTFSASKAAAHSLAQCLRAEMRPAGVRVGKRVPRTD
jgi:NAD(P)-dependent dehydrogenase (short-subunit alcohol dehydrogenase family)